MPDLRDGESVEIKGSAAKPYILRNVGGVFSCTCPSWRNQSIGIERRTCKHLRKYRGEQAETDRIGSALPARLEPEGDETSTGPGLLLAQTWTNDVDFAGWWMSEKLDGVRAYWDGPNRRFLSRQGNIFYAPDWFIEHLPDTPLDGELWLGRKSFQRTVSIVRRQDKSDLWRELSFVVFDGPAIDDVFERRLECLRDTLSKSQSTFVRVLEQLRCRDLSHLQEELARVDALGGEGLMLRQPGSRYEAGRSATLLKVKRFHDAEARVIGHLAGAGRHKGRLGALDVELPNGTKFSVGTGFSDAERENPPPVGSVITFRYQELSDRGVPRFPSFVRVRRDVETSQVAQTAPAKAAAPATPIQPINTNTVNEHKPMARRFEFVGGTSAKFWEVSVTGAEVTVRYGRLGTQGQSQTKTFEKPEAAAKHANKLIGEKTKKGYQEVTHVA
jgi:DNA ligase-1